MSAEDRGEGVFSDFRTRTAHDLLGVTTPTTPFRVRFHFHYIPRWPLPAPADPEVGITTTGGSW